MWKVINAVAVTLLIALISVVPSAFAASFIPDLIDPGLQPVAIAAWVTGLVSWWLGATMVRNQHAAAQEAVQQGRSGGGSHAKAIGMTVGFLALALGAAAALHIFGDGLL